jgi:hypothetical protein
MRHGQHRRIDQNAPGEDFRQRQNRDAATGSAGNVAQPIKPFEA